MQRIDSGTSWRIATSIGLFAIGVLFVLQLAALVHRRVDYPLVDDWRYYRSGFTMPLDLSLRWLFAPGADTLHVTGKLLDWLIFRLGSHSYRVLAIASFAFGLGGWLVATVGLCLETSRGRPSLRMASLLAFLLPLSACPFWVTVSPHQKLEPAIAYHQMLPMLGLSTLAWIVASKRGMGIGRLVLCGLVTVLFSLAYASGAVATFFFGVTVWIASWIRREHEGASLRAFAIVVTGSAGICLLLHVGIPAAASGSNPVLETRDYQATLPFQRNFWQFFFGLFDRAVLSTAIGALPTWRGAAVAIVMAVPLVGLAVRLWTGSLEDRDGRIAIALVAVIVATFAFAALAAYGRADFGARYLARFKDPELRATQYAHSRFFFWWITAILPATVVAWGILLGGVASRRVAYGVTWGLLALALLPKPLLSNQTSYFRSWDYDAAYRDDAEEVMQRLRRERRKGVRRREIVVARKSGATFVQRWSEPRRQPRRARRPPRRRRR